MNLGGQILVNKQSLMPSSSGASWNSAGVGDGSVPDQFPAGLRVLVVDDDPTCLMILEKMLKNCKYEVTKCNRAEVALSLLRENKNGFDVVISDVHMPDMNGFKLLEHIGLEMDLPVIMMSADDSKSVVMKGVTHGACDYLIKPVRIEALRNIWQHVVRKRKHEWKDFEPSTSLDDGDRLPKQPEDPDCSSSANEGHNWKNSKRRKDNEDEAEERDDTSSTKKPRVVWSVELHQQFVAAVNQLGIDKAVPKKILDLMNVPGLTRENVASHLQKYRLYLRRLSGSQQSGGVNTSFMGNSDPGFGSMSSLGELDLQALAASGQLNHLPAQSLATLQAAALGRSSNSTSPISVPVVDQRNIFSFENPKPRYGHVESLHANNASNGKQMNLLHGIPTTMEPKQLMGLQHSFRGMNGQGLIPMSGQSQNQSQTRNHITRPPTAVYNPAVSQASSLADFPANHRTELNGNGFPLGSSSSSGIPSLVSTPALRRDGNIETNVSKDGFIPGYDPFNNLNQNRSNAWGLQNVGLTFEASQHMQAGVDHNYASGPRIGGGKVILSTGEGSGTHVAENPSQVKPESINYVSSRQPLCPEQYGQDDLLTAILSQQQQQQQEGVGQQENEFGFDWYSLDNLPV